MDLGIDDRVALVMGASKGLGRAVALALAREGARVAIASRDPGRIGEAAHSIAGETGASVKGFAVDTGRLEALPALVDDLADDLGSVEILVTNTGGPPHGDPLSFERGDWETAYRHMVLAPLALIGAVVPAMREARWGRIVNVTSIATEEPIPGLILSNSHRLAAVGAFKTLADALAPDGILLNSAAPGRIATDRIATLAGRPLEEIIDSVQPDVPVRRLGRAEEFGAVVAFLCSDRASYVCGVNLPVDGGARHGI